MSPRRLKPLAIAATALLLGACASHPPTLPPAAEIVDPAPVKPASPGAIYSANAGLALFEDRRARQVGDTLTVLLTERTQAQKSAATSTSKNSSVSLSNPTLFGKMPVTNGRPALQTEISGDRDFEGSGNSSQSNQLDGQVTVTVVRRLNNGNLVVEGEKWLTLNQGREVLRLRGVVRPDDISPDNTVSSTRVAQAQIVYDGRGAIADSNAMGWATRFFNSPWWPF